MISKSLISAFICLGFYEASENYARFFAYYCYVGFLLSLFAFLTYPEYFLMTCFKVKVRCLITFYENMY